MREEEEIGRKLAKNKIEVYCELLELKKYFENEAAYKILKDISELKEERSKYLTEDEHKIKDIESQGYKKGVEIVQKIVERRLIYKNL